MKFSFNALRALGYFSTRNTSSSTSPQNYVSMHFVLWGTSQHTKWKMIDHFKRVSMHFVLWGTSQLTAPIRNRCDTCFNALRALGYFSTGKFTPLLPEIHCFNALRALGYFSTPGDLRQGKARISFNALRALGYFSTCCHRADGSAESCFNALRALGYFSTGGGRETSFPLLVSMHFVLWGTSQPRSISATLNQ